MEHGNLKMPIKVTPYRHQEEAFKFVCECYGLTKSESQSEHANIHFSKKSEVMPINISRGRAAALLMEMG